MPRRIVVFTKSALDDLDQDIAYLEENAGEKVALRYLQAIEETVQLLADFPDIGTHCSFQSLDSSSVRRKAVAGPFSSWLLFYRVTQGQVEIARILRDERNWLTLFA